MKSPDRKQLLGLLLMSSLLGLWLVSQLVF